ncbi:pseudouridine synthase [Paucibacter sp. Y2R2-4]|uniref:pseudouridine synthase n=1 Tax=Paucibacter sp. Y2R2-4 TaxID=2893553 RepID=UPI0021E392F6|nr:pseudouridine synthase [Paucibacter sp. Y2R2-4]MCV2351714.1 pseudouridine synthase [Paucibacter sp. Y2R2-4]
MSRAPKPPLPLRHGVSASAVAMPSEGSWPLILDFLDHRMPQVGRAIWLDRMANGAVLDAQGQVLPSESAYRPGERLYYYREMAQEPQIPFEETILFQDETLLVADKPHFLPVTPSGRYVQETLLTRLKRRSGLADLSPIHRIDRETAGLVVFCIQPEQRGAYQAMFRDRVVDKVYEAIAPFKPELALPLTRRSRLQERSEAFMQMEEVEGACNAETRVTLLERLSGPAGLARYALYPSTGQKHQLRAHMNALGLPLIGDRIYPDLLPVEQEPDFSRPLQLLARELSFVDPISGQVRRFTSRLRLDLA